MKKRICTLLLLSIGVLVMAQTTPWQALGPIQFPKNTVGQINGMGRATQLKFHPSNPAILYATAATGGLWTSRDTGLTWQATGTDSFARTNLASVCVDYTNDQILYIGTGDPNYYYNYYGVYKSTNGGATWLPANTNIGSRMAVELLMSPLDHNTIIAATNDGIWKTTNGGATWTVKQSGSFVDMKFKPVLNSSTIYASTFTQFFKSEDMGESWTAVSSGITIFPDLGDGNGTRIAVTKADTSMVYFLMLNNGGSLFKSRDNGNNFSLVRSVPDTSIVGYDIGSPGQGNYNMSFTVSNLDTNEVYVNTHCIWRSLCGGAYFEKLTAWPWIVHTDMHQSVFSPYFPDRLYNINDGGIWISTTQGVDWKPINDGFSCTEFYHAGQSALKNFMIGGTQDNGGLYCNNNNWFTYQGGDVGSTFYIDNLPRQNSYQCETGFHFSLLQGGYDSTYLPTVVKGNDVKMVFSREDDKLAFASKSEIYRTNDISATPIVWTTTTAINKKVMDMRLNPLDRNILYFVTADAKVWRMNDATIPGTSSYYMLSAAPASTSLYANILPIRSDTTVLYLTCGNKVYRSNTSGATWTNITGSLPSVNIINILNDELSSDESVYLCTAAGVYYRNMTMPDWQKYSKGLSKVADIVDFMAFDDGSVNRSLRVAYFGRGTFSVGYNLVKSCLPSAGLTATNSGNNVLLNWSSTVNTSIAYRKESEVKWTTLEAGVANSYLLTGLHGCEKYEIRIRTRCASDTSLWSGSVFISTPGYPLPAIWTYGDIGAVGLAGDVCYDAVTNTYAVTGSGDDVWNTSDQFFYMHTPVTGNVEATCRVVGIGNHYGWAKAGWMIRETLDPDSKHAMVALTPGNGVANQWRSLTADWSSNFNLGPVNAPVYIRLSRADSIFRTYYSYDNLNWIFIAEETINMNNDAFVGLFSCSHENDYLHTAIFDKVSLTNHPNLAIANLKNPESFNVLVYPNPAKDVLQVSIDGSISSKYEITISDLVGHLIQQQQINGNAAQTLQTIDISHLAAGIYQIEVRSAHGRVVEKFIKN